MASKRKLRRHAKAENKANSAPLRPQSEVDAVNESSDSDGEDDG